MADYDQHPNIGCMASILGVFIGTKRSSSKQREEEVLEMAKATPLKEAPRLSLDSRVVMDAKGNLRPRRHLPTADQSSLTPPPTYSPGVVARLMGVDAMAAAVEAHLTRSASDSRTDRFPLPFVHLRTLRREHLGATQSGWSKCRRFDVAEGFSSHTDVKTRETKRDDFKKKQFSTQRRGCGASVSPPVMKQKEYPDSVLGEVWRRGRGGKEVKSGGRRCVLVKGRVEEKVGRKSCGRRLREDVEEESSPCSSISSGLGWPLLQGWRGREEGERGRRRLLERCEELIQSIEELQPSPVSVLDRGLYREDVLSTRVKKRAIDFVEEDEEEEEEEEEEKNKEEWEWDGEVGEVVVQLEQLVFKDIITETIGI